MTAPQCAQHANVTGQTTSITAPINCANTSHWVRITKPVVVAAETQTHTIARFIRRAGLFIMCCPLRRAAQFRLKWRAQILSRRVCVTRERERLTLAPNNNSACLNKITRSVVVNAHMFVIQIWVRMFSHLYLKECGSSRRFSCVPAITFA